MPPRTADVFCRVIDNLGDAGVCWRLAGQLAGEHGLDVRLWIDRPQALARIADRAVHPGVSVLDWIEPWPCAPCEPADLVVAAFACRLPDAYLDAMARRRSVAWFNLEYLSAEPWVAEVHGLASPRPDRPLVEHFFVPGFDARSGGLLRERGLLAQRDAFQADGRARARLLAQLGAAPLAADETLVSMFCYAHAPLPALADAWRRADRPVRLLLPEGVGGAAIEALLGEPPAAGLRRRLGALCLEVVPLVPQPVYDRILWSCDVNFVRGEDSFVRAQWAGRPLWWHIYPQADGADRAKLDAFVERYLAGAQPAAAQAARRAMRAWNGDGDVAAAWAAMRAEHDTVATHARRWSAALAGQPDLTVRLLAAARAVL